MQQQNLRKSDVTRRRILDAALDHLWSRPFRELSVSALMEQVGSTRSTFYQYFADIHELMKALLTELEAEFKVVVESLWLGEPADPQAAMVDLLSSVYTILYDKGPIVRAALEAAPLDARLSAAWDSFLEGFDLMTAAAIRRDQAAGLAPACDAMQVALGLNRVNVAFAVQYFGQRPRTQVQRVLPSAIHIWTSTIYGGQPTAVH